MEGHVDTENCAQTGKPDRETGELLNRVNRTIIRFRGLYSAWSGGHGIGYNEMLVLYTVREFGYCTQKQISDSYLLPRQTVKHVFSVMRRKGLLEGSPAHRNGREKAFVLSRAGQVLAKPFLDFLNRTKTLAVERFGTERLQEKIRLLEEYNATLCRALHEIG